MRKLIPVLFCVPLLIISCINDTKIERKEAQNKKDYLLENTIISFNITSKNSKLTSKKGKDVSTREMITKSIHSGEQILFKGIQFTLDRSIEGALNFYSNNGKLMCRTPFELSIMSMPPDGKGAVIYKQGDDIELPVMSMIKIDSTNFVISNIKL